jgi:hypothetical protein
MAAINNGFNDCFSGFIIPQKDVKGDSYVIIALKTSISTHNFFYYDVI